MKKSWWIGAGTLLALPVISLAARQAGFAFPAAAPGQGLWPAAGPEAIWQVPASELTVLQPSAAEAGAEPPAVSALAAGALQHGPGEKPAPPAEGPAAPAPPEGAPLPAVGPPAPAPAKKAPAPAPAGGAAGEPALPAAPEPSPASPAGEGALPPALGAQEPAASTPAGGAAGEPAPPAAPDPSPASPAGEGALPPALAGPGQDARVAAFVPANLLQELLQWLGWV